MRIGRRLFVYLMVASVGAWWFYFKLDWQIINVPFLGDFSIGWLYLIYFIFIVVATSFSMNETDGLDGLSGGTIAAALAAAVPKSAPQKERIISSFKSWGRDPFAIGTGPAEEGSGPVLLSGIFCDPPKSYCIIDGKVAKVGDEVSGYRILEISKDTVTVKVGDEIRVLRIGR